MTPSTNDHTARAVLRVLDRRAKLEQQMRETDRALKANHNASNRRNVNPALTVNVGPAFAASAAPGFAYITAPSFTHCTLHEKPRQDAGGGSTKTSNMQFTNPKSGDTE